MPKSSNQKLKLLYLIDMLKHHSNEEHPMPMTEILKRLEEKGIKAERKSIYDDVIQLNDYGYDIVCVKSKTNGGYYMASRDFELAELKLLVDSIQASRFITAKKSKEMIGKLSALTDEYSAKQLKRQVYVANRVKASNESIFYAVDAIHRAMQENQNITFQYFSWSIEKKMEPRHEGKYYEVSPWMLTYQEEEYYLVAYDPGEEKIKHFRVDKMLSVSPVKQKRKGGELFESSDVASYSRKTFSMYSGEKQVVTICFENRLIGVVIDRFGKDIDIRVRDDNHFSIRVSIEVSPTFYGWLTTLGNGAYIMAPEAVRSGYANHLKQTLSNYETKCEITNRS